MKIFLLAFVITAIYCLTVAHQADATRVRSYYRSTGRYVQKHYRSNADGYKYNNYSYKGNLNPYTGKKGSKN